MKLGVVGSRGFSDRALVFRTIKRLAKRHPGTIIVSGGARGVDSWAAEAAREAGLEVEVYLPDWDKHGKAAGFLRNTDIVAASDAILAFHDGVSRGTMDTVKKAKAAGKRASVITCLSGGQG